MSDRASEAEDARRAYAWFAAAAVALTFAVIVASAFLRHAQAGLSCDPWPGCYARVNSAVDAEPSGGVRAVRMVHRLSATAVTAAILGLVFVAWTQRPVWIREGFVAAAAFTVAGGLAVLGVVTSGSKLPAVVLGNLLGGYLLLALVAAAWTCASSSIDAGLRARTLALGALILAFAVAALGGSIGAHYASRACPALIDCDAGGWVTLARAPIDLLRPPAIVDGHPLAPAWAAALHIAHRIAALALLALVFVVAQATRKARPWLALAMASTLLVALGFGFAAVSPRPLLAVVVLHNAAAATLIALLAMAIARSNAR